MIKHNWYFENSNKMRKENVRSPTQNFSYLDTWSADDDWLPDANNKIILNLIFSKSSNTS